MTTINATPASLPAVLKSAAAGDTITLADGLYAKVTIEGLKHDGLVTITGGPGAKVREVQVTGSKGWRFAGLDFDAGPSGYYMYRVNASENVHFEGCHVHGSDLALTGPTPPQGISFLNGCRNVSVTGGHFEFLTSAVAAGSCFDVVIAGNHIHDMATDGIVFAECAGLTISDNDIHDLHPGPGAHPDGIQGLTVNTKRAQENIVISRNHIARGKGGPLQGVFLGDEARVGYKNVRIEDNLLDRTGYHGITQTLGEDIVVRRNTLISVDNDQGRNWILLNNQVRPVVEDNQAIAITVNSKALASGEGGNVLNQPTSDNAGAVTAAWRARFRAPPAPTPEPIPEPPKPDALRAAMAVNTGAKVEPLKTKGRLIVEFKTPAQAAAALAAVKAL